MWYDYFESEVDKMAHELDGALQGLLEHRDRLRAQESVCDDEYNLWYDERAELVKDLRHLNVED